MTGIDDIQASEHNRVSCKCERMAVHVEPYRMGTACLIEVTFTLVVLYQRIGPHHKIGAETHTFIDGRTGERKCAHSVYSPAAELNTFRVPSASLCLRAVIQRSSILDIHGSCIVGKFSEGDICRKRIDTLSHRYMPRIRGEILAYGQFSAAYLYQIGYCIPR